MSTIRKLRRMTGTPALSSGPQKPRPKIADAPEDARRLIRYMIRHHPGHSHMAKDLGVSQDKLAADTEQLIDRGILKIVTDRSAAACARTGGLNYKIVPTGKF